MGEDEGAYYETYYVDRLHVREEETFPSEVHPVAPPVRREETFLPDRPETFPPERQGRLAVSPASLAEFCRRHHIRRLSFFGSVLRDDFRPDSDIDVLVEFAPDHVPGLALVSMQDELSALLGERTVDLVTPKFINHRIRDQVLAEAQVQHVEG